MTQITYLFVDDSRVSRMKIKQLAAQARPDWQLLEASSAEEAIEKTTGLAPDLISLDINMPGMDGLEAAKVLRQQCPASRIVFVSGNIQDDILAQARAMGMGFVEKPITQECIDKILSFAAL